MFTTRHELALLRVSTLTGLVMFGGMSSLFYTQMTGILSVSADHTQLIGTCPDETFVAYASRLKDLSQGDGD